MGLGFAPGVQAAIAPEARLVLACCRLGGDGTVGPGLAGPGLDWRKVVELACRDRVLPLVADALSRHPPDMRPPAVASEMRRRVLAHAGNAILLTRELARLLASLRLEGIRALTFKGPALAMAAYGRLSLRMFNDIDVLVDEADYARCCAFLSREGFVERGDFGFERTLRREGSTVSIDLHRSVSPAAFPCALEFDELWQRRRAVRVGDHDLDTLSTGDHLMVLCVQITRDRWEHKGSLAKLCDVARLAEDVTIDWEAVLRGAGALGFERRLLAVLAATEELLAVPLPAVVTRGLDRQRGARELGRFIGSEFLRRADDGLAQLAARIAFHFRVHERPRHKLAQLRMVPIKLREAWLAHS